MLAMLALALGGAPSPAADPVIGRWRAPVRNATIDISRCGASICGRIVSSEGLDRDPGLRDVNNHDAGQRGRPLRGLLMLSGFTRDGDAWSGGRVYNPDDGRTYSGRITPTGPDQIRLRGCVFYPLCKTQTWTRVR